MSKKYGGLAVAVVSNRDHHPDFSISLLNLFGWMSHYDHPFEWVKLRIKTQCSLLPAAREEIFEDCIEQGCSHILCLDDDMTFPMDVAAKLAAWDKPFVAANCATKNPKFLVTTARDDEGNRIQSRGLTGLCEVSRIGLAVALIDLREYAKTEKPHFEVKWQPAKQKYLGEDMYFCDKWRRSGRKIYIDHGVSNEIGHIGTYLYRFSSYAPNEVLQKTEKAA